MLTLAKSIGISPEFKCYNTLITDEWRQTVLDRHNELRRRLSDGKVKGSDGMLPTAGNINMLKWDCQMEMLIDMTIGECNADTAIPPPVQPDPYGVAKEMVHITGNEKCNASSLAKDTLNKWWKEGAAKQKVDRKVVTIDSFTQMAYAKIVGFACSYRRCGGNFFLVCFYNKTPIKKRVLYVLPKARACDKCEKYPDNTGNRVECENFLCQYPLTPGEILS
ncbi:SCP-like protein [Ancylostoma caninum]|uniref:SCP-like protein n=1 Tax=Ancylostoma caninum TaxID=29170 RepID=A0A368GZU3_ANCCA|nr:SCP-like protein [Ancylostoma caninum]